MLAEIVSETAVFFCFFDNIFVIFVLCFHLLSGVLQQTVRFETLHFQSKDLEENIIDQKGAEDQAKIQTEHVDAVTAVVKQWNISHQKDHEKDQSQKTKLPVFPLAEKAACGYELFLQQEYQWGRA